MFFFTLSNSVTADSGVYCMLSEISFSKDIETPEQLLPGNTLIIIHPYLIGIDMETGALVQNSRLPAAESHCFDSTKIESANKEILYNIFNIIGHE